MDELKINRLRSDSLLGVLDDREVLIERPTVSVFSVKYWNTVTVELRNGTNRYLRTADVVHAVSGFPGILLQQVNAYVNLPIAEWLGCEKIFSSSDLHIERETGR